MAALVRPRVQPPKPSVLKGVLNAAGKAASRTLVGIALKGLVLGAEEEASSHSVVKTENESGTSVGEAEAIELKPVRFLARIRSVL